MGETDWAYRKRIGAGSKWEKPMQVGLANRAISRPPIVDNPPQPCGPILGPQLAKAAAPAAWENHLRGRLYDVLVDREHNVLNALARFQRARSEVDSSNFPEHL